MLTRRTFTGLAAAGLAAPALSSFGAKARGASDTLVAAMTETKVPGMAAMVIRNFKAEPELCAGVLALGGSTPVRPGARWHFGSNGKSMTATLIARLVEGGVLSWDKPLAALLPELAATMNPAYRDVTLSDLLSHRAGLPENTADMDFFATFYDDAAPLTAQRWRYVTRCLGEAPVGPARAESNYSNTGYILAAACAERATSRTFEALMASDVFGPLGMGSVSFNQFGEAGEPMGHADGRIANRAKDANPRMFAPAGAFRMSLSDWASFCIEHLQGEYGRGKLLRQDTYRFLHAAQGASADGGGSALGWGAAPSPMKLTGPALTHAGSDGNWYALVCLFTKTGNGVLAASNAGDSMGGDRATAVALRALAGTVAKPAA
jgi:CubicO group peptidase (beta-lactamase class C family)